MTKPASRRRRTRKASCVGDAVAEQVAADGDRHPGHGPVVLDRDRHPGERPGVAGTDRGRLGQRLLGGDMGEGADPGLERPRSAARTGLTSSRAPSSPSRTRPASSMAERNSSSDTAANPTRILSSLSGDRQPKERPMSADAEVKSGLEGVVAFATEIAEPDRAGGALRYRGVDIEELVGKVPFEQVWGLLVDGTLLPGHAAGRAAPAPRPLRRSAGRRAVGAGHARPAVGFRSADRHHRRGGARQPGPGVGHGAVVRRPVGPRDRQAAGPPARGRPGHARSPSASSSAGGARPTRATSRRSTPTGSRPPSTA